MIPALLGLLACQLAGEVLVRLTHLPIPGPVAGLVLMLAFLVYRKGVPKPLEATSQGLLSHLSLLFIPAGVGIVAHLHRVAEEWVPLTLALVVSTVATLVVTALVFALALRFTKTKMGDETASDKGAEQ